MATGRNIKVTFIILQLTLAYPIFGNALSDGIVQKNLTDASEIKNNEERNAGNSREDLAADAKDQGSKAGGIAIGIGITLITTGIPMTMSIDPITVAAGWDLIAKGGQEIGQGAQDLSSAGYNGTQEARLNNNEFITANSANVSDVLNNPELDKAINSAGVNPDEFKAQLAQGQFQSGSDIMRAFGKDVDPEVAAQAQLISDQQLGKVFGAGGSKGEDLPANTITASKENEKNGSENNSHGFSNFSSSMPSRDLASTQSDSNSNSSASSSTQLKTALNNKALSSGQSENAKPQANGFQDMLNKLLGRTDSSMVEKNMLLQGLAGMGIQIPVKGVSVFDLARRNYRQFGNSRKGPKYPKRVALR